MLIKTTKEALMRAVGVAGKAIPQKASIPMLENFLLSVEDGKLDITATDSDTVITAVCEAGGEGKACIGGKMLSDIVKLLPDGEVTIETENTSATITWPSGRSSIPCYDTSEYPEVNPQTEARDTFAINGETLCSALAHTLPHASVEMLRPQLTGIHFNPVEDGFDVVASDSHTICIYPVQGAHASRPFTIGAKVASAVASAAAGMDEVEVEVYEGRITFICGGTRISGREIIGKYPAYQRIIPTDGENTLKANIKDFTQALRRVALCSNRASNHVKLELTPLGCEITAQDLGFGATAEEAVTSEYFGTAFPVGFKHDFLLRSIAGLEGDGFEMRLTAGNKAVLVTSPDDPCKVVIMPVAIQ